MCGDLVDEKRIVEETGEAAVLIGGEADEEKDQSHLEDADEYALFDMAELEVAYFVSEDGEDFWGGGLIDQGIE